MFSGTIHPENIAKLDQQDMEKLIFAILGHVNRSLSYNTGPLELSNRILTELIETDLLEIKTEGCGGCSSCSTTPKKEKSKIKREGKIIQFPKGE
ncbi:hypothetical protein V6C27_08570 [Peptococcaceae bacterium 1198_IL3148]